MNEIAEKIDKIAEGMYNVNRQISWKFIAMRDKPTEKIMNDLNRFIGEWIKQLRDISEELK